MMLTLLSKELAEKYHYNKKFTQVHISHDSHHNIMMELSNGTKYKGSQQISDFIYHCDDNIIIKEDYHYWNNNNKDKFHGKALIIDKRVKQLFFDDNDCVYCLDTNDNVLLDAPYAININTILAQIYENYYTDHINRMFIAT